ncbi:MULTISPECIES: hypothetical protein [Streptomyces]|uniref:Uncharacterized protein n=3 Tax=Streptomyces TaxID=1883 RepID=M3DIN1_STREZ|nr:MULTISPECIES: hypothetical protein [Streptomyces]EMF29780.1 hypothetical protein H114_07801 [Streptomyces gancidicus BKS 13-15]MCI4145319.1 hypothetical protein [Streptomyces sp. MMS20-AI2-20]GGQ22662.1 hypothetical protein GCM10010233_44670 [Streptomyces gancidicus]GGS54649.1 hypothetical protein GCM10010285_37820 [Streptomyces rubiginosus]
MVAPVRPTVKARYPLAPIETYMRWRREDGSALDPWIRTHQRLGATLVSAAPESQVMTGTVAEVGRGRVPGAQRLDAAPLTAVTAGAGGRTGSGPGR